MKEDHQTARYDHAIPTEVVFFLIFLAVVMAMGLIMVVLGELFRGGDV